MGSGILFKALLQTSFSLMVFGWTQIVRDVQPFCPFVLTNSFVGLVSISVCIKYAYTAD
jgi:hypothetical protein